MFDVTQLIKLGWDNYAKSTKAERSVASEYTILKLFSDLLPKYSTILDVGCGSGKPITTFFSNEGHNIHGIDISPNQINKAKLQLPKSNIKVADMLNFDYPDNYYHGVVCLHSLVHVERIYHAKILRRIYQTLKPGGLFLISVNTNSREGVSFLTPDIQMFYSHFDQFESIKHIISAKLSIIHKENILLSDNNYIYIIAKKSGNLMQENITHIVYSSKEESCSFI